MMYPNNHNVIFASDIGTAARSTLHLLPTKNCDSCCSRFLLPQAKSSIMADMFFALNNITGETEEQDIP